VTHDELLAKIEENRAFLASQIFDAYPSSDFVITTALRAVVELHTPSPIPDWVPTKEELMCWCAHVYPCPTIQAIEKELS
jgi:hypothetical protein